MWREEEEIGKIRNYVNLSFDFKSSISNKIFVVFPTKKKKKISASNTKTMLTLKNFGFEKQMRIFFNKKNANFSKKFNSFTKMLVTAQIYYKNYIL